MNAHGFLRLTKDAALVIALDAENIHAAFAALATLGYRPLVPVNAEQFADPALREAMIRDKGMKVLQFFSDAHRQTPIDVFVIEPFDFGEESARALRKPLAGGGEVPFVSLRTLLQMKRDVARVQDLLDVEQLELLWGTDDSTA